MACKHALAHRERARDQTRDYYKSRARRVVALDHRSSRNAWQSRQVKCAPRIKEIKYIYKKKIRRRKVVDRERPDPSSLWRLASASKRAEATFSSRARRGTFASPSIFTFTFLMLEKSPKNAQRKCRIKRANKNPQEK